jgi:hypothetical protein
MLSPIDGAIVPGVHAVHPKAAPGSEYVPAGQSTQAVPDAFENFPAGQIVHSALAATEMKPAAHPRQEFAVLGVLVYAELTLEVSKLSDGKVIPVCGPYRPAGHGLHFVRVGSMYFP